MEGWEAGAEAFRSSECRRGAKEAVRISVHGSCGCSVSVCLSAYQSTLPAASIKHSATATPSTTATAGQRGAAGHSLAHTICVGFQTRRAKVIIVGIRTKQLYNGCQFLLANDVLQLLFANKRRIARGGSCACCYSGSSHSSTRATGLCTSCCLAAAATPRP